MKMKDMVNNISLLNPFSLIDIFKDIDYLILVLILSITLIFVIFPVAIYSDGSSDTTTWQETKQLTNDSQENIEYGNGRGLTENKRVIDGEVELKNNKDGVFRDKFFWSVLGGFIGAIIALWLESFKKPVLLIEATEEANQEHVYPQNRVVPGRWKFFRVRVSNKSLPNLLSWLMSRETAESVHAQVIFKELGRTMKGRWAGTLELPFASPSDRMRLANYPEPETVFVGKSVILDIFAKFEQDNEAYGWNNEAYLHSWRTPHYKLDPGNYEIEITLIGINSEKRKNFVAHIGDAIEDTYLREVNI